MEGHTSLMIHLAVLLWTLVSAESLLDEWCGESVIFRLNFSMFSGVLEVFIGLLFSFLHFHAHRTILFHVLDYVLDDVPFRSFLLLVVQPELLMGRNDTTSIFDIPE